MPCIIAFPCLINGRFWCNALIWEIMWCRSSLQYTSFMTSPNLWRLSVRWLPVMETWCVGPWLPWYQVLVIGLQICCRMYWVLSYIITWLCDILALVWHFGPACVTFLPGLCDILALSCVTKASACHHTPILTTGTVYRKFHRSSVSKTT